MKIERAKNTKTNITSGFLNKFITLFLPFVVRTVLIQKIGVEYLGLNSLFSSILQVINLADLGFGNAVVYCLYKPIAEDDILTIKSLINYFRRVYKIIGIAVLAIGLALLPFLDFLINGEPPSDINIYVVYLVYLGNASLTYILFTYKQAIPNALQRVDIATNINSISLGIQYLLQILLVIITKNYYLYIIALPVASIINSIITKIWIDYKYPEYKPEGEVSKEQRNALRKQVTGLMINKLCQVSRNSFDSIFVSAFLGLTITAIYNNYYYIMFALIGFTSIFTNSMVAGIGNSIVTETREKNYNDLRKINFLYMWLSGFCTICLFCLYQPFMSVWVGNELTFPITVALLFSAYFYCLQMGNVRAMYSDAAGLWWENRYRAIIEAVCNIILNYLFVMLWGVTGIVLATICSILVINFGFGSQIVFEHYFRNGKLLEYFSDHTKYLITTVVIGAITFFLTDLVKYYGIVGLLVKGIICCLVSNILYVVAYHRNRMFKVSISWLVEKLKKA